MYTVYIFKVPDILRNLVQAGHKPVLNHKKKYELNIFSYSFFRHCMQYAICSNAKYCNLFFGILFYVEQASQLCSLACTTVTDREFDFYF